MAIASPSTTCGALERCSSRTWSATGRPGKRERLLATRNGSRADDRRDTLALVNRTLAALGYEVWAGLAPSEIVNAQGVRNEIQIAHTVAKAIGDPSIARSGVSRSSVSVFMPEPVVNRPVRDAGTPAPAAVPVELRAREVKTLRLTVERTFE